MLFKIFRRFYVKFLMPVYSAGAESCNRLGRPGSDKYIPGLVPVETKNFACLAVGWHHNILIYQDGSAVCWGKNNCFQLGMQDISEITTPITLDCFPGEKLTWAHCGDKSTTFLTSSGKVYTCGSSTNKKILELQIHKPAIYVSSGCSMSVAIDIDGAVYKANSGNTSTQRWELPDPVCDVACGDKFVLALTTKGQVFGLDNFAMENGGSSKKFIRVPSLSNIVVSRVFAYNNHAAVITRDGRVMMCGEGDKGQLGFGDTEDCPRFEFLTDLDGANITEIDMGDSMTVFVGLDGSVYSCGQSHYGSLLCGESTNLFVPTKSSHIPGKAVFVRCGCFHTVVVTDSSRPVHPGLKHFDMGATILSIPRSVLIGGELVNTAASSIVHHNLMPGDIVTSKKHGEGFTIGVLSKDIVCCFNGKIVEVPVNELGFKSRTGYIGTQCTTECNTTINFDGGDLCSLFGFNLNDEILGIDGSRYNVLGFAHGTIWFQDLSNMKAYCMKSDDYNSLHSFLKVVNNSNVEYKTTKFGDIPIRKTESFYVICKRSVYRVIGYFSNYYYAINMSGIPELLVKSDCSNIQYNGHYFEYDRVIYDGNYATVLGCLDDSVFILTDDDLVMGNSPIRVSNSDLELVSRFAGPATRKFNDALYDISIETNNKQALPNDLIHTKYGFSTVIGSQNSRVYCINNQTNEVRELDVFNEKFMLIKRHFNAGNHFCSFKTREDVITNVNVSISALAGVGFMQGDEVLINDKLYIVVGAIDTYLWFLDLESLKFIGAASQSISDGANIKLVSRPTTHTDVFL